MHAHVYQSWDFPLCLSCNICYSQLLKRKEETRLGYGPEDSEEIKVGYFVHRILAQCIPFSEIGNWVPSANKLLEMTVYNDIDIITAIVVNIVNFLYVISKQD